MIDQARKHIRSLESKKFSIDGLIKDSTTQVLSFTINTNKELYEKIDKELYCSLYLSEYKTNIEIENISLLDVPNQLIYIINKEIDLGVFKRSGDSSRVIISHSFDHNLVPGNFIPKYYKKILKKLIFNFNHLIKSLRNNVDKENEDDNDNDEEICEECELEPDECLCQNETINTNIKFFRVIPLICNNPIRDLFDLNENFYSFEHNIYTYEPSNLLEHQLKSYPPSPDFLENCYSFILKMSLLSLFFKSKFPKNLILCETINHQISSISLAPAFTSDSEFLKWFDLNPKHPPKLSTIKKNFKTFITKSMCKSINNSSISPFNLISSSNFSQKSLSDKSSLLGAGGFAEVYKNSFETKSSSTLAKIDLALKLPFKNGSESKVEIRLINEFKAVQELSHPNIVKTFGIFKNENSLGLCLELLDGKSLKQVARLMSSSEKIRAMKQVANGILWIHKLGFVHQDIKPSNVIISRNKAKIIDFGFAVKEEMVPLNTGFTLEYADPLHLKKMKPGQAADVWSWGITFVSLFLDLEPYKGVLDNQVFRNKRKSERGKDDGGTNEVIERIWQEVYVKGKRPDFKRLETELDVGLVYLLKDCLNAYPENRPKMDYIAKFLNSYIE